jgi:hypothetical protein
VDGQASHAAKLHQQIRLGVRYQRPLHHLAAAFDRPVGKLWHFVETRKWKIENREIR